MDKDNKESKIKDFIEWIYCIIIAIILAVLIKYYIGTPTVVQQSSMYPTLVQGDRLILNRIARTTKKMPKRGQIITFEAPTKNIYSEDDDISNPTAKYERQSKGILDKFIYDVLEINKTSYIKRVIALPGEHLLIKDGKVYINDKELKEDYLVEDKTEITGVFYDLIVPEGTVFVMGDHRSVSMDSRAFGCIPQDKIESIVAFRFWPFNKFGKIK